MQKIVLNANASKTLLIFYSVIFLIALAILISLSCFHYLSWYAGTLLILLQCIYYFYLCYKINPNLNHHFVVSAMQDNESSWQLEFTDKTIVKARLKGGSILTNRFALLNFKIGTIKTYGLIIIHTKTNQMEYHRLAKWWHSDRLSSV